MIKHLKVKTKLLGSFSVVIVLFCAAVAFMIYNISTLESLNQEQSRRNQDVRLALELKNEIGVMYSIQSDVIVNEDNEAAMLFLDSIESFKERVAQAAALIGDPNEADGLTAAADGYIHSFGRLLELHNIRNYMKPEELNREFQAADGESDRHKEVIFTTLDALVGKKDAEFRQAQEEMSAQISRAVVISGSVTVIAVLLTVGLSLLTGTQIAGPLLKLAASARRVAAGDLTGQIAADGSKDEIGQLSQSFSEMVSNLKSLIRQVNATAEEVAASSEQLTASAEESAKGGQAVTAVVQQVAAGAEAQEKASAESSIAMDEMASGVQKIAASTSAISELAQLTADKAKSGSDSIRQVMEQMSAIRSSVDEQVNAISRLENKSKAISDIIGAIRNIAKQTNLLALNAAIEASRAGEGGKGFAVVAGEVRSLAEQSRESAERIAGLIGGIQEDIRETVKAIKTGRDEVKNGMVAVEKSGESFWDIYHAVEEVTQQIQEMSALAEQMSAGSEEVAASVAEMSSIARETSRFAQDMSAGSEEQMAIMEQISTSAAHLSSRANALQEMIGKFKV